MEKINCDCKKTIRSEEDKKNLITRINRILGSLEGVKKMIEDDRYCKDVLIQLSAIDSSIKSLSSILLEYHLKHCIKDAIQSEDSDNGIEEIIDLFKRFN